MDSDLQRDAGRKYDGDKPMVALVLDGFSRALYEVAKVATFGAQKYAPDNWVNVPNGIKRYRSAGDRHRLQRSSEALDPESGLSHLAHEAWNRLAELELVLRAQTDARHLPGAPDVGPEPPTVEPTLREKLASVSAYHCGCGTLFPVKCGAFGCPNCEAEFGPATEVNLACY